MSFNPLKGKTVIDLSRLLPGPFCSLILSDLGARVIKIEDTQSGDYLRGVPPQIDDSGGALFHIINRNKESLVMDLKNVKGREIFLFLIKKTDVLIESFRPGGMDRLNLSYSELKKIKPSLIVASITGYGQEGSNKHRAGHDLNYLSLSGLLNPPHMPCIQWSDIVGGGLWGAFMILAALNSQNKEGVHLDISMTDSMTYLASVNIVLSQMGADKNILSGILGRYRMYKTADDKYISLAALEDKFWDKFCDIIKKDEWKSQNGSYLDFSSDIHSKLETIFCSKKIDEWVQLGEVHDICLTQVLTPKDVVEDKQFKSRQFFYTLKLGENELKVPSIPLKGQNLSSHNIKMAPKSGEHTKKILEEIGYSEKDIESLREKGVIKICNSY